MISPKFASRAISSAPQIVASSASSRAASLKSGASSIANASTSASSQASSSRSYKSMLRMRIVVNGKGIIQNSRLSSFASPPMLTRGVMAFHSSARNFNSETTKSTAASSTSSPSRGASGNSSAYPKPFYAEVKSNGVVALAGSMASFDGEYSSPHSYRPSSYGGSFSSNNQKEVSQEFRVGNVQTAGNVVYSNKHSE